MFSKFRGTYSSKRARHAYGSAARTDHEGSSWFCCAAKHSVAYNMCPTVCLVGCESIVPDLMCQYDNSDGDCSKTLLHVHVSSCLIK